MKSDPANRHKKISRHISPVNAYFASWRRKIQNQSVLHFESFVRLCKIHDYNADGQNYFGRYTSA